MVRFTSPMLKKIRLCCEVQIDRYTFQTTELGCGLRLDVQHLEFVHCFPQYFCLDWGHMLLKHNNVTHNLCFCPWLCSLHSLLKITSDNDLQQFHASFCEDVLTLHANYNYRIRLIVCYTQVRKMFSKVHHPMPMIPLVMLSLFLEKY